MFSWYVREERKSTKGKAIPAFQLDEIWMIKEEFGGERRKEK
jgi:hypothetical protein